MDRYNEPEYGYDKWHEALNENFADAEIEIANEVATWSDLPATTEVEQSSNGQWPIYRVNEDNLFVKVSDSAKSIVGGLGSSNNPLPSQHVENQTVSDTFTDPAGVSHTDELEETGHGHSGESINPDSINTEVLDNEIHPQNWPGADLGEKINNCLADVGRKGVHLVVNGGGRIETPVNLTDLWDSKVELYGDVRLATAGQPAIDCTDTINFRLEWDGMKSDPNNMPSSAILSGHELNEGELDYEFERGPEMRWFIGGEISGPFEYAPVIAMGKERNRFAGDFVNTNTQGYAVILSSNNDFEVAGARESETSPYKTLDGDGGSSVSKQWFSGCSFEDRDGNAGDGILYLEDVVEDSSFTDCEFRSCGGPHVRIDMTNDTVRDVSFRNIRWRAAGTDTSTPVFDVFDGGAERKTSGIVAEDITAQLVKGTATTQPFIQFSGSSAAEDLFFKGRQNISGSDGLVPTSTPFGGDVHLGRVVTGNAEQFKSGGSSVHLGRETYGSIDMGQGGDLIGTSVEHTIIDGEASRHGIISADGATIRNLTTKTTSGAGEYIHSLNINSDNVTVENVHIPEASHFGIRLRGANAKLSNIYIADADDRPLRVDATGAVVTNAVVNGTLDLFDGAECIFQGQFDGVSWGGARHVVNGHSVNSGDPNSTGDWNGFADLANRLGVTVWDTSVSPNVPYEAGPDGNWN